MLVQERQRPFRRRILDVPPLAIPQRVRKRLDRIMDHLIRLALFQLKGPDLIHQLIDHVAQVQRVQHTHAEIYTELESRLSARSLYAVSLLEQQHTEAIEPGVLQRKAVFSLVPAEAPRATRAGREEDIVVDDLLAAQPFPFELLQIPHQIADREIRRVALTVVAELLACLEIRNFRSRDVLAVIPTS